MNVLKVEISADLRYTVGTSSFLGGEAAYPKEEAIEIYQHAAEAVRGPFIYLSAGVNDDQFRENLEMAIEAKADFCGVFCGRATWKKGILVYARNGLSALEDWLSNQVFKNIQALNQILEGARCWRELGTGRLESF